MKHCGLQLASLICGLAGIALLAGCGAPTAASPAPLPAAAAVAPAIAPRQAASQPAVNPSPPIAAQAAAPAVPGTSPKPKGQPPPTDRTPSRPGEAVKIVFEDLNLGMQADMVYRPFLLTDRAKELDGQRVSISGYMHGGAAGKAEKFVLLKNTECKFGPGGQADHLAMVHLAKGSTIEYQAKPVKVEGTLKVEPMQGADGNTWSIYRLDDAKVTR